MGSIWHNYAMHQPDPFHDIASAPKSGAVIEMRYGTEQETTVGYWNKAMQGWVRVGDQRRIVLRQVTGWRPVQR
jgi:hypothetical protein